MLPKTSHAIRTFTLLSVLWIGVAATALASEETLEVVPTPERDCGVTLAQAVQAAYRDVRTLSAEFEQTMRTASIGSRESPSPPVTYRGKLLLEKPGKMRWTYESPEPSVVVSDGKILWIYDPQAREVQKLPMAEGLAEMAGVRFLLGDRDILQDFRVRAKSCDAKGDAWLELVPRQMTNYEALRLRVQAGTGRVLATEVHDLFGNVTKVELFNPHLNEPIPASQFSFQVPSDVEVIELSPSPSR